MLEVKSEKMVKRFFPKSFLDDLGGVTLRVANLQAADRPVLAGGASPEGRISL
jgi:hypothetical protein